MPVTPAATTRPASHGEHVRTKRRSINRYYGERSSVAYDALFLGAFFGVLIAVGLYHVLMYVLLRNRELLAYAVYVAALLAEEMVRTGFAADFLLTGTTPPIISSVTFAFLAIASFWFFTSFLQMRERAPRAYRAIRILTAIVVLLSLALGPFGGARVLTLIQLLSLLTLFAVFVVAVDQIRRGERSARYFIIAFCGVLFGAALFVLGKIFWPETILVKSFELGTAFEAIALALGLADRIRLANEERDLAQRRILEETRSLNVAYARFVPREFLELLGKDDVREVRLGEAVQREMTVLFSDIRSFTTISEKMSPRENFDFLNGYLERVGPIVRQYRGVIDKYIGDAIMGLFASKDADDALRCAIGLQREVAAIDVERTAAGLPPIAVGVGLHTGTLMLGTIGESERMDGTVIADAVNLASRVEGLTKNYGAAVLLTEQTRERLADPSRYALRHLGRVAVKGKAHGVGLYEACDADAPRTRDAKIATLTAFDAAVEALGGGRFEEAHGLFGRVLEAHAADGSSAYLQKRCEALVNAGEPWDGVDHVTTK
jgi:class 3 adenylate cyclase